MEGRCVAGVQTAGIPTFVLQYCPESRKRYGTPGFLSQLDCFQRLRRAVQAARAVAAQSSGAGVWNMFWQTELIDVNNARTVATSVRLDDALGMTGDASDAGRCHPGSGYSCICLYILWFL